MLTKTISRRLSPVLLAIVFSVVALFSGRVNAQNILSNGGFELGLTAGPSTVYRATTYGAWSSSTPLFFTALLGMPYNSIPAYEGNEAMQVPGGTIAPGEVHQSFTTTPGTSYRVSLAVCLDTAQATVFSGTTTNLVANFVPPGGFVWGTNSYTFIATGPLTTLSIRGGTNAGVGNVLIDDVRVVPLPIINDSGFELGLTAGPGGYYYSTTFGAWSGVGSPNNLFLFGMPFGSVPAYEGREAMYIGDAGFVSQSFSTAIGQKYWVSFALNGIAGGADTARVTVFSPGKTNLLQNVVSPGGNAWGVASYPFFASNSVTTLKIQNVTGYSIIDDVRVSTLPLDMALKFDGVNDYVNLTNLGNRLPTTEVTVEFWQRVRLVKAQATFALSVDNGANRFAAFVPYSDGTIIWDLGNINSGVGRLSYKPAVSIVGNWQHFALVSSAVGNYMRIYRNGVLEAEKTGHSQFTRLANDLHLGRSGPGYFDGDLDEFRIWNVARTDNQIAGNLNTRLTGNEPGLVAYYRMDEESGSFTLLDATTNANNGTLSNGVLRVASTVPASGLATQTEAFPSLVIRAYGGYQAAGVAYGNPNSWADVMLFVTNLSANITPVNGSPGVDLNNLLSPAGFSQNLTLNYAGGIWTNLTSGDSADGLRVRSAGPNGGTGEAVPGISAGAATVNSSGSIITSGANSAGIHAISQGGAGGPGTDNTVLNGDHGGPGGNGGSSTVNSSSSIATSGVSSPGIFAISQGGNGGNGGDSTFASGAYGGVGGNAGNVTITGSNTITTAGAHSMGVLALSQAGQGGNGGSGSSFGNGGSGNYGGDAGTARVDGSWTITTFGSNAVGISARSLGGAGGQAGNGTWASFVSGGSGGGSGAGSNAIVNLELGGTINTYGKEAHGILAQSIGGFAGAGGDSGLLLGSAGSGGSAGNGGNVTVTNKGTITTRGVGANAIFAESVGGGGGSGGSGGLFTASGAPQAGGDAGQVTVNNQGVLQTTNNFARGIFAHSVGGSGGNGATDQGLFYSVGGAGGQGGKGGTITVTNNGQISTLGSNASGIFAQSIGGGGGTGGGSVSAGVFGNASIGGSGGPGGNGARVSVYSGALGSITNVGDRSHGIFAESVGGGGGSGGFSLSGAGGAFAGGVAIGGKGGVAGDASNVVVNSQSAISTAGKDAHGIFAQSVGGGGGVGGYSIAVSGGGGAAALSLGGTGGAGGNGNSVDVASSGAIRTTGDHSYGVLAQSLGGGGGDGGFSIAGTVAGGVAVPFSFGGDGGSGGVGGNVVVNSQSQISTGGKDAHGIFVQSVGGGGGSGAFSVSGGISGGGQAGASVGGKGGSGSAAGNVTLTTTGAINTANNHSYGILAQSIGGGGGDGGFSVAGGMSGSAAVNFSMGGSGGAGGVAGNVALNSSSSITTAGTNSHAIFAQSLGGGGGSGGFSVAGGMSSVAISASIGGAGGSGANASNVTVNLTGGAINTTGDRSYGLLAQSVGGGGGDGGFSVAGGIGGAAALNFAMGGAGGVAGHGDTVAVTNRSSITTDGRDSHGIFAQSVGGGGGSGGFSVAGGISANGVAISASIGGGGTNGGNAGKVSLTNSGAITTSGDHSYGILAQSVGGGGGDGGFSVAGGISDGPAINVGIGGGAGPGGKGAIVELANSGNIYTRGELSYGLFAQSVGGGGGSGGFGVAGSLSANSGGLAFGLGGSAGSGADADRVSLFNGGNITTTNKGSHAIMAQSIGGGGGAGGFGGALVGGFGNGANLSVGVGGKGGTGGNASNVVVRSTGSNIVTRSVASYGIFAQSVGGGGGDGGAGLAVSLGSQSKSVNLALGIGRSGGSGGIGGDVAVNSSSAIQTEGIVSHGIVAQSIGGGGGNGGFSVAGSLSTSTNAKQMSLSFGGTGGAGGSAGNVSVTNSGRIITLSSVTGAIPDYGTNLATPVPSVPVGSVGILAQSIGGGGGNGGLAFAGTFSAGGASKNVSVAVGGDGGAGGTAGVVGVQNSGVIDTHGENSYGVLAQSIGGGGGNGGASVALGVGLGGQTNSWNANLGFSLGGDAGYGNVGGTATVNNLGNITTRGPDAHGIFAQSLGGGGGAGGNALTLEIGGGSSANNQAAASIALGGDGGAGNSGGTVTVTNSGQIVTSNDGSHGIYAQSIGGGGGSGGKSKAMNFIVPTSPGQWWENNNLTLTVSVGGSGGSGSHGGSVVVDNRESITTAGVKSYGILAQSIGAGGGSGGSGISGTGTFADYFAILSAEGFLKSAAFNVGGNGGASGNGGQVSVKNTGKISTTGLDGTAIYVQSIGGGGGIAQAFAKADGSGGSTATGLTGKFGLGGAGGASGDGGEVNVLNTDQLDTVGTGANGILAQSIGGGGGVAGDVSRGLADYVNVGVGLAFARDGGGAGNGGAVAVTNVSNITTRGTNASGIYAQSVGGGGGVGGGTGNDLTFHLFSGSVGGVGDGGKVDVNHTGNITNQGNYSYGIFAQSSGGTDGAYVVTNVQYAGVTILYSNILGTNLPIGFTPNLVTNLITNTAAGLAGAVNISVAGNVIASGTNATGIFAQSTAVNGGSDISISILNGTVRGGSGSGVGVSFAAGANNTLLNYGAISSLSGLAILGTSGNETIHNHGTVLGSVNLGAGQNAFNNYSGATLNLGASGIVNLGAGNTLGNNGLLTGNGQIVGDVVSAGAITPGNSAGSLIIDGDLNLLASANMTFEIGGLQQGVSYDFMRITNFVQFAGTLSLSLINNFLPTSTDLFTLMEFDSSSGLFGNVLNGGRLLTLDNLGSFQVSYTPTSLQVGDFQPLNVGLPASIQRNASGHMVLQFPGVSGNHYAVEYRTNLNIGDWTAAPSPTFTFPTSGLGQWIDDGTQTDGLGGESKFYQVKLLGSLPGNTAPVVWISRNASGPPVLLFAGSPGHGHIVEYTTDLNSGLWTPVTSAVFTYPDPGLCQWVDDGTLTGGLGGSARFYRVKQ